MDYASRYSRKQRATQLQGRTVALAVSVVGMWGSSTRSSFEVNPEEGLYGIRLFRRQDRAVALYWPGCSVSCWGEVLLKKMAGGEQISRDFYAVLGLQKECTASELKDAYKKLALVSNSSPIFFLFSPLTKSFFLRINFQIMDKFLRNSFLCAKSFYFYYQIEEKNSRFWYAGTEVAPRPLLSAGKLQVRRGIKEEIPGRTTCLLW